MANSLYDLYVSYRLYAPAGQKSMPALFFQRVAARKVEMDGEDSEHFGYPKTAVNNIRIDAPQQNIIIKAPITLAQLPLITCPGLLMYSFLRKTKKPVNPNNIGNGNNINTNWLEEIFR